MAKKQDKNAVKEAAIEDRNESVSMMEPLLISEGKHRKELSDLVVELVKKSTALRSSLPAGIVEALGVLLRTMNCYYSNLIEGHDTHPIDIERALNNDYSQEPEQRNLQKEARAHVSVQRWIDEGGLVGCAASTSSILTLHKRFCELLPEELLWIENPETKERIRILPGQLRQRDVKVGQHIPISPGALPRFLKRFEAAYAKLGGVDSIIAAATAHHRLLWMHPFLDGNGRVARLMSYSMLSDQLDTGGIWSIARGLARNESNYKSQLMRCDLSRRNDLDGRGNLSEEALAEFVKFFLEVCIDQVSFMKDLVQPDRLRSRILIWAEEEIRFNRLPSKASKALEAVLYRGELLRGEMMEIVNANERTARRITSALIESGVLVSNSSRAPLRLGFPASLASRWMPGLFPEK
ncbi:MAG: Fic family protein [Gammaproteobacteria bacterium]